MKTNENDKSPAIEVVEFEAENAILAASGENSIPEFGE